MVCFFFNNNPYFKTDLREKVAATKSWEHAVIQSKMKQKYFELIPFFMESVFVLYKLFCERVCVNHIYNKIRKRVQSIL